MQEMCNIIGFSALHTHTHSHTQDLNELVALCSSQQWSERRDGMAQLHMLLESSRLFTYVTSLSYKQLFCSLVILYSLPFTHTHTPTSPPPPHTHRHADMQKVKGVFRRMFAEPHAKVSSQAFS